MLFLVLILDVLLFGIQIVALAIASFRARFPANPSYRPRVSIIVAARNEEANIGPCLTSLSKLDYPKDLLEVVVIDDRSTDRTQSIARSFADQYKFIRLVVAAPPSGLLQGKTNAVVQGIESSSGEILLFTDADCVVLPSWVSSTVQHYEDEKVGIVAGFTALDGPGWFAHIQAIDWFALFTVASGAARIGVPITAVGNNLSVRRSAYDAVGGYRKIPFSVTEDYALFHAITAGTEYEVRFPMDPRTLVSSTPCRTMAELHRQKSRWFRGGRGMDLKSLVFFGAAYALNALLLIAPFVSDEPGLWIPYALKLSIDLFLPFPSIARFGRWKVLPAFLLYEVYYFVYVLLYPPLMQLRRNIVWKDREYTRAHG